MKVHETTRKSSHYVQNSAYLVRNFFGEVWHGFIFRVKLIPQMYFRYIVIPLTFILIILQLSGESIPSLARYVIKPGTQQNSDLVNKASFLKETTLIALLVILLTILLIMVLLRLRSKERLFIIATQRLNDRVKEEKRATNENPEAQILVEMINSGKPNSDKGQFLSRLWSQIIEDYQFKNNSSGLSMFQIPGSKEILPIVSVNIDHLYKDEDLEHPEKLLNSLIKIKMESRFPDYSLKNQRDKYKLLKRKPYNRYLSRYPRSNKDWPNDYEGYNACLQTLTIENGILKLPIECTLELYGNILDSSDMLINELYLQSFSDSYSPRISPQAKLKQLPWRNALHKDYSNPVDILIDVKDRAAGFGLAVLTVINVNGTYVAYRGIRSSSVGTFQNAFHVIPSGMTNYRVPKSEVNIGAPDVFLDIQHLIEKEFIEEWYDRKYDTRKDALYETIKFEVKNEAYKLLYGNKNNSYKTQIFLTGIVFDLLNYRPEICALILINNPKWWVEHNKESGTKEKSKVCDEFDQESKNPVTAFNIFTQENILKEAMPPNNSCLSGIAAFHLGIQKAREVVRRLDE